LTEIAPPGSPITIGRQLRHELLRLLAEIEH